MRRLVICFLAGLLIAEYVSAQDEMPRPSANRTDQSLTQKASYLIGYNLIQDFKSQQIEFDIQQLLKGIEDAAAGRQVPMSDEEVQSVMLAFQRQVMQREEELFREKSARNQREGDEFLRQHAQQPDVRQLDNGVQYKILQRGEGATPQVTDRVKVHYKGTFINGQTFDTSHGREPVVFGVANVIRGMSDALQQMREGDKWELVVPSSLGYGLQGSPPVIGPNQVLIFELELIEIVR